MDPKEEPLSKPQLPPYGTELETYAQLLCFFAVQVATPEKLGLYGIATLQTNKDPYSGGPRASAAAVHGGWDDVAAAERAGAGRNSGSGSGSGPLTIIKNWIWIWNGTWTTDFGKRDGDGAAEMEPLAMHVAYAPSTSVPKHRTSKSTGKTTSRYSVNSRNQNGQNRRTSDEDPNVPCNPKDADENTYLTDATRKIIKSSKKEKGNKRLTCLNNHQYQGENNKQTQKKAFTDLKRKQWYKKTKNLLFEKTQGEHAETTKDTTAGKTKTAGRKNAAGKPKQRMRDKQENKNHQGRTTHQMEDLNETIRVHIKKTHIDELAKAGGIGDRSSKAKLGRILNPTGITVPVITESALGNKLTFECTRGQFHFLNQEIAIRGDSRMFFERSKEDESAKPTIMLMEVTNPLRKDGQTIAKEVADIFDEFAGVKSLDRYGKEDTNSRSGKVVVSISYNTEEEKTQALDVSGIPYNGHHVYPVDPNEPVQTRIDRERPRWMVAPNLEDGTEIRDWFKIKDIQFQRIKMHRSDLEVLVTTPAEVDRWDGRKVTTLRKKRKKLEEREILPKKSQQITTEVNGYKTSVTLYRKYVKDVGGYRLRDHCRHCQRDHPSHLCHIPRHQEDSDWQKVADERLVFNFSSADIARIEKSVRSYVERKNGLTQAEARGCQTLRIKVDPAWIQKENRRNQENPKQPHTQPQTKPTLGRRETPWTTATTPAPTYNAIVEKDAMTTEMETRIREMVKKMAEKETEREAQLDKTNEASHAGNAGLSTWMVAVDKAITRLEDNQLRTDRNMDRIDRNIDRLEVETGVAQGEVFDNNEGAMDIEDEDVEATTPIALKLGRTKNE
ncbi:hypothetical protein BDR26DRAFT_893407 [Obelidium mucronatum]|nr:hypothetical protein BDR26DRAFT_893407 [Obelidium mucronatum]